jgi:branched-chain amino acid transport system ATP-binding protein
MVLACGPDLLLVDEPTAGMSPQETSNTARVLRELNQTGLTLVVIEHDMTFVREIAQRVTVLHQGRIFADGSLDEVTQQADVRDIYLGRK